MVRQLPRAAREPGRRAAGVGRPRPGLARPPAAARPAAGARRPRASPAASATRSHGPVRPGDERRGFYEGNPSWTSTTTGGRFAMRPEDGRGPPGIGQQRLLARPAELLAAGPGRREPSGWSPAARTVDPAPTPARTCARASSAAPATTCACSAPTRSRRRARRALQAAAQRLQRVGRLGARSSGAPAATPASCQDCHMSASPGSACRRGARARPRRARGQRAAAGLPARHPLRGARARRATRACASRPLGAAPRRVTTHYFSGVDVPLTPEFDDAFDRQPDARRGRRPARRATSAATCCSAAAFRFDAGEPRVARRSTSRSPSRSRTPAPGTASPPASARSASSGSTCGHRRRGTGRLRGRPGRPATRTCATRSSSRQRRRSDRRPAGPAARAVRRRRRRRARPSRSGGRSTAAADFGRPRGFAGRA